LLDREFFKPSADDPVLPIVHGLYLHTKNVYIIDNVREHNFAVVSLSVHSMYKMLPLDFGYMTPVKRYYAQEIETKIGSSLHSVVTTFVV